MTDRILTRQEMVLLHLMEYVNVTVNEYTMPFALTQDGIGAAVGISRSHAATVVGILEDKGLVAWVPTHPKGATVRRRTYYLLPRGIERARELRESLAREGLSVDDVIRRPGACGNGSPNVVRAVSEFERALMAAESLRDEGDPAMTRTAIMHASMAIASLSREVA